ncbi:MAG: pilus assembly protein PilM [Dehalococcoidia bacterium]|nr:MAG: pilus assembly protein PilM [Dehalococcoidia bacterium]
MAKKVVTLYVDDTSLSLLVAHGERVKKCAVSPLESGLVKDGVVVDETKVATIIRGFFKAQKVKPGRIIAGLSGFHCLSQLITLPRLPEAMLAEAIKREAERVLPVPLDELYISWQIIPASGEEMLVFLVALPRKAADALIKTLHRAGVKPYLMDLAPLALARVVDKDTAIVVNARSSEFDIVIIVEGVPQLIRSLSIPGEADSPEERLSIIRGELERTIKFYNSSHPDKPFEPSLPIFVSGEMMETPETCQSLADELKYSVSPLSLPVKCPKNIAVSEYMVNIGLVFKEISFKNWTSPLVVDLNVLPEVYRPKAVTLGRILVPVGMTLGVGVIVFLAMLAQGAIADTVSLQEQVDVSNGLLEIRLEKWQAQSDAVAELDTQVEELEATNDALDAVLDGFSSQQATVNGDLTATISTINLPSNVDLGNIRHASDMLAINGISTSETEVLEYAKALEDTGRFSEVIISGIASTEDGVSFTLTLSARR